MQQVWITEAGAPEVLELREAPTPEPGPGAVLVRVEAAGINFADILARQGLYPDAPPLPAVVGYEVGGVVEAVGAGVERFAPGDAVLALTRFGGYASHALVPEVQAYKRPEGMSAAVGASIPVNYLTAYQAMVVMGGLRHAQELGGSRMRVLVHGASGGVGTAAADLGRIYGVELFGTASPHKHGYVRERGYDHAINYRDHDWLAEVQALTDGRGVDLVLDPIGGAHWKESFRALAPTGRVVIFGFSAAAGKGKLGALREVLRVPWRRFLPFYLINANRGVLGVNLGHLWDIGDEVARWSRKLLQYYERGQIRPHVDRAFPLAEAAAAHRYIEDRRNVGKVVLEPGSAPEAP
ncbi:MAG: zinc-binding dehydrogenase [Rhodothermales bacterium]|nr:zinc-binding dehydrogenase [Rhodothermales bacterium]